MGILDFLAKATKTEQDRQAGMQASALGRTAASAAWDAEKISRDIEAARRKQNPEEAAQEKCWGSGQYDPEQIARDINAARRKQNPEHAHAGESNVPILSGLATEPIFRQLSPQSLSNVATYLKWEPLVSSAPARLLSELAPDERMCWLDEHRPELQKHLSWVGTPIFSHMFGNARSYRDIVLSVAEQLRIAVRENADTPEVETAILQKLWKDTLGSLKPEERAALLSKVTAEADRFGPSVRKEVVGFAGLAAAQMSGFGVYILGSTLLGAINSALGLGLGFGVFTGLSSLIAIAIGPLGWAALGLFTMQKLGAPNYKKLLPVIILIAVERATANGVVRLSVDNVNLSCTEQAPKDISATASRPPRIYSKAEKMLFQLRPDNLIQCKRAEELCDRHFLDLSLEEQQVIRKLVEEEQQSALIETEITENNKIEARKQREQVEHEQRVVKKEQKKLQSQIKKRGRSYSKLLPNLRFDTAALERLEWFEKKSISSQIEAELGQMNAGRLVYRDSIANTDPKVYEAKAGSVYRIYFYHENSSTCIRLVGDKDTQESDIKQLRNRARGVFA
jgi:uncharacterized protein YaaW (UPF0174 family)